MDQFYIGSKELLIDKTDFTSVKKPTRPWVIWMQQWGPPMMCGEPSVQPTAIWNTLIITSA
ncbi:MAG: hypothetical protein ACLR0U_28495 [Enterocloster clostridioformis]